MRRIRHKKWRPSGRPRFHYQPRSLTRTLFHLRVPMLEEERPRRDGDGTLHILLFFIYIYYNIYFLFCQPLFEGRRIYSSSASSSGVTPQRSQSSSRVAVASAMISISNIFLSSFVLLQLLQQMSGFLSRGNLNSVLNFKFFNSVKRFAFIIITIPRE